MSEILDQELTVIQPELGRGSPPATVALPHRCSADCLGV